MLNYFTVTFKNMSTYDFGKKCFKFFSLKENNLIMFEDEQGTTLAAIPAYEIKAIIRSDQLDLINWLAADNKQSGIPSLLLERD